MKVLLQVYLSKFELWFPCVLGRRCDASTRTPQAILADGDTINLLEFSDKGLCHPEQGHCRMETASADSSSCPVMIRVARLKNEIAPQSSSIPEQNVVQKLET